MKQGFYLFWTVFKLFYAIPFPMLLYYNTKTEEDITSLKDQNPWLALGIVVLSIVLWCFVLAGYFRKWILDVFVMKHHIGQLKKHGVHREATILDAAQVGKENSNYIAYELRLLFRNLVNQEIVQKTTVNDFRPQERRFEAGKKVGILVDKEMKQPPYFIFETSEASINKTIIALLLLGWLAFAAAVIGYYVYAYQTENHGMGWRFMRFWHPLVLCPVVFLGYRVLSNLFTRFTGKPDEEARIKFKGIRTTARLISASQTGTYINEQPQVQFELEFTDDRNRHHRKSIKKIVDLLNLNNARQATIDIFFLKEDPGQIAFASDLDELS